MEVIKINVLNKPLLILTETKAPIKELLELGTYKNKVMILLKEALKLYKNALVIDMIEESPFFTFYANALGFRSIYLSNKNKKIFTKNNIVNNSNLTHFIEPTKFNNIIKGKKIAYLLIDNIKKIKYCLRPIRAGNIHNIIIFGPSELENFNLHDILIKASYSFIKHKNFYHFKHSNACRPPPFILRFD